MWLRVGAGWWLGLRVPHAAPALAVLCPHGPAACLLKPVTREGEEGSLTPPGPFSAGRDSSGRGYWEGRVLRGCGELRPPGFQSAPHTRTVARSPSLRCSGFPAKGLGWGAALRVDLVLLGPELGLQSSWGQGSHLGGAVQPQPRRARPQVGRRGRVWVSEEQRGQSTEKGQGHAEGLGRPAELSASRSLGPPRPRLGILRPSPGPGPRRSVGSGAPQVLQWGQESCWVGSSCGGGLEAGRPGGG